MLGLGCRDTNKIVIAIAHSTIVECLFNWQPRFWGGVIPTERMFSAQPSFFLHSLLPPPNPSVARFSLASEAQERGASREGREGRISQQRRKEVTLPPLPPSSLHHHLRATIASSDRGERPHFLLLISSSPSSSPLDKQSLIEKKEESRPKESTQIQQLIRGGCRTVRLSSSAYICT